MFQIRNNPLGFSLSLFLPSAKPSPRGYIGWSRQELDLDLLYYSSASVFCFPSESHNPTLPPLRRRAIYPFFSPLFVLQPWILPLFCRWNNSSPSLRSSWYVILLGVTRRSTLRLHLPAVTVVLVLVLVMDHRPLATTGAAAATMSCTPFPVVIPVVI